MKERTILKSFSRTVFLAITFLFVCFNAVSVLAFSTTISPGNSQFIVSVSECCPTFSWAAVEGADSYEIAVFSIQNSEQIIPDTLYDELRQISVPTLTTRIPAPALSWTPTREQGFSPGKIYAWHVRSLIQNSPGEWSTAAFFKVPETTITNLDTAVNEAVTDFLTETDENFIFWSGLEERIAAMVTDKITESPTSVTTTRNSSEANLRGGDEGIISTNVWYGYKAGDTIDTQGVAYTKDNVFIGRYAGAKTYDATGNDDTADYNVFVGNGSGYVNTTGFKNAFVGFDSGHNNTTGSANAFFGSDSGLCNTTGEGNAFFGHESGLCNSSGKENAFFGLSSGYLNITGGNNAFFGCRSGYSNTGSNNAFFGSLSGYSCTTGSNNVFIGNEAAYYETGSNKLYIANSATASPLIYGDFAAKQLKINGTLEFTTAFATSDQRWKKDIKPLDDPLAKVLQLNGKSYLWRRDEFPEKGFSDQRQIGLIAQEVEKIIPELVNTDKDGYKSISYAQIIPLLVEAVKELNSTVEILKNENAELRAQVNKVGHLSKIAHK